ncbi:MAG: hypothetical protein AB7W06_17450 [Alphaproteobacteria bacterium]
MSVASLSINTVTVDRKVWTSVHGQRTATSSTAVLTMSIQPMRASRARAYGLDVGVTGYTAYCATDPSLKVGDTITWGSKVLSVLASPRDEAGRGVVWATDCKEIK